MVPDALLSVVKKQTTDFKAVEVGLLIKVQVWAEPVLSPAQVLLPPSRWNPGQVTERFSASVFSPVKWR